MRDYCWALFAARNAQNCKLQIAWQNWLALFVAFLLLSRRFFIRYCWTCKNFSRMFLILDLIEPSNIGHQIWRNLSSFRSWWFSSPKICGASSLQTWQTGRRTRRGFGRAGVKRGLCTMNRFCQSDISSRLSCKKIEGTSQKALSR